MTTRSVLERSRNRWRGSRRRWVLAAVLAVLGAAGAQALADGSPSPGPARTVAGAPGASSGAGVIRSAIGSAAPTASAGSGAAAVPPGAQSSAAAGSSAASPSPAGSGPSPAGSVPNEVPALATKVIKTGSVSLQVAHGQLNDVLAKLSQEASALGGFVAGSSVQTPNDSGPPSGSLSIRVPAAAFESFVAYVQRSGTVLSISTSGQDVTASYVDLQARITALQGTRSQFEQILARATTIGDILSVESQISDLETQIEQLQGQFNVLDNQTSYSTLTVSVAEKPAPGVVSAPKRAPGGLERSWLHARHSFAHGVEAVIGATGGIAVFLVFAGLIILVGRLGWKAIRGRWAS